MPQVPQLPDLLRQIGEFIGGDVKFVQEPVIEEWACKYSKPLAAYIQVMPVLSFYFFLAIRPPSILIIFFLCSSCIDVRGGCQISVFRSFLPSEVIGKLLFHHLTVCIRGFLMKLQLLRPMLCDLLRLASTCYTRVPVLEAAWCEAWRRVR